jgi:hypothetical protein
MRGPPDWMTIRADRSRSRKYRSMGEVSLVYKGWLPRAGCGRISDPGFAVLDCASSIKQINPGATRPAIPSFRATSRPRQASTSTAASCCPAFTADAVGGLAAGAAGPAAPGGPLEAPSTGGQQRSVWAARRGPLQQNDMPTASGGRRSQTPAGHQGSGLTAHGKAGPGACRGDREVAKPCCRTAFKQEAVDMQHWLLGSHGTRAWRTLPRPEAALQLFHHDPLHVGATRSALAGTSRRQGRGRTSRWICQ